MTAGLKDSLQSGCKVARDAGPGVSLSILLKSEGTIFGDWNERMITAMNFQSCSNDEISSYRDCSGEMKLRYLD